MKLTATIRLQLIDEQRHYRRLRQSLQAAQTDSARRHLKKLAGREQRFATDANHRISKRIVEKAKGTTRGIALEDLMGLRERVTARKARRATLHSWAFSQLRSFIEYKAERAGLPVVAVDPRNTSRASPAQNNASMTHATESRNCTSSPQFADSLR